jgi:hypothetical protein
LTAIAPPNPFQRDATRIGMKLEGCTESPGAVMTRYAADQPTPAPQREKWILPFDETVCTRVLLTLAICSDPKVTSRAPRGSPPGPPIKGSRQFAHSPRGRRVVQASQYRHALILILPMSSSGVYSPSFAAFLADGPRSNACAPLLFDLFLFDTHCPLRWNIEDSAI